MSLFYPDKIKSSNSEAYGIVDSVEVSGSKTVSTKNDLFNISESILSINNSGTKSLGNLWWVEDENSYYVLNDFIKRKISDGWTKFSPTQLNSLIDKYKNEVTNKILADETTEGSISKSLKDSKIYTDGKVGNLTNLATTEKNNAVSAINEVNNNTNNNSNKIGDLNSLVTTNKTNLVSAINEVSKSEIPLNQLPILPITKIESESFTDTPNKETNKVATSDFVNSSINALAAFYITKNLNGDSFDTKSELLSATRYYRGGKEVSGNELTNNDYCFILSDESHPVYIEGIYEIYSKWTTTSQYINYYVKNNENYILVTINNKDSLGIIVGQEGKENTIPYTRENPSTRYVCVRVDKETFNWSFQYIVNNTPLTIAQIKALNSGIDSSKVLLLNNTSKDLSDLIVKYDKEVTKQLFPAVTETLPENITLISNSLGNHTINKNNPHNVTKSQVGLGNVTNDKQVIGLSDGTTENNILVFGSNGYNIKDVGVNYTSIIKEGDNRLTDARKNPEKLTIGGISYDGSISKSITIGSNLKLENNTLFATDTTYEHASDLTKDTDLGLLSKSELSKLTATGDNSLTTKSYVDNAIDSNSGTFCGTYDTWNEVPIDYKQFIIKPAKNSYLIITNDDGTSEHSLINQTWRYKYTKDVTESTYSKTNWNAEYKISNTLQIASSDNLGGVKINGNNLSIDSNSGLLSATDTTYEHASDLTKDTDLGLLSKSELSKLSNIENGAEVNQNTFSTIKVNDISITSSSKTDTIVFKNGSNINITNLNKEITIESKHPVISKNSDTSNSETPSFGSSFTAIDSISTDSNGHVLKTNVKTITIPNSISNSTNSGLMSNTDYSLLHVIDSYIMTGTSSENKLVSRLYMEGSMPEFCGNFDGFNSGSKQVPETITTAFKPHKNSYIIVTNDNGEKEIGTETWRYIYPEEINTSNPYSKSKWKAEYKINIELPDDIVRDSDYKHITITDSSVTDGSITFNQYVHPTKPTSLTPTAVKVAVDNEGHVQVGETLSKNDVGLNNVENKSSSTIRSEITKNNVIDSLGYTPADISTNGGNVYGPSSSTDNHIAIFDGTTGKNIKDSGFTIEKSVPVDAKFTDTTYSSKTATSGGTDVSLVTTGEKYTWNNKANSSVATTSSNGLMSSSDKNKLNGIAEGANNYVHPTFTAKTSGLYKITVNKEGHISEAALITPETWTFVDDDGVTFTKQIVVL